jgi:hypothetical protein
MTKKDPRSADKNAVARLELVDDRVTSQNAPLTGASESQRADRTVQVNLLLATQLFRSTPVPTVQVENAGHRVRHQDVLDLYLSLAPRNALESILVRYLSGGEQRRPGMLRQTPGAK